MTYTATGHYYQNSEFAFTEETKNILKFLKIRKRNELGDILIVYPVNYSISKIEKYKSNEKYVVKYEDLIDFFVLNFPEYLL